MENGQYGEQLASLRNYFAKGATRSGVFRIEQLKAFKASLLKHEAEIFEALRQDLGKCAMESFTTEFGFVIGEIDLALKHLKKWMKPVNYMAPPVLFPASTKVMPQPRGVALIIGAWNYPIQLTLAPMVAAIAAGCCVVVKPSEVSERSSAIVTQVIKETFAPDYVTVIEGGVAETSELLKERFDYIFFTGSTHVGRIVYEAAAKNLTPVTLELGGKSPCIVDATARMDVTARRICWGKFVNAGQTCVAPDYVLVDRKVKDQLVDALKRTLVEFYGSNPIESPDFGRIVNDRHFQRLSQMLGEGEILHGGQTNQAKRFIAPTLIHNIQAESSLLTEEIFGPILPILEVDNVAAAIEYVTARPHPLALYVFSEDADAAQRVMMSTTSGGACINDAVVHLGVPELPFGGVGNSGIGAYHGRHGFDTFSHAKGVLKNPTALDVKLRYPPYKENLKILRRIM